MFRTILTPLDGSTFGTSLTVTLNSRQRRSRRQAYTGGRQFDFEVLTQLLIEAPKNVICAKHYAYLAAQAREKAGEFERDISGALNNDPSRLSSPVEEIIGSRA